MARQRAHHELRPHRQGRLRSAQAERLVVVEPHPDDGQQLGCEADEPRIAQVVGGARLAGGFRREPRRARRRAGALVDYAAHHVGHEKRGVGARHPPPVVPREALLLARADDPLEHPQRLQHAAVGEQRVCGGDLERRRLEHAQRDRGIRARRRADADPPPQPGDLVEASQLGHVDGRDVARHREGPAQRNLAVVFVLVVARAPWLPELEGRRLVEDERCRGQVGAPLHRRPLERGQVDERLEDGARLPPRGDRAVELRLVVRPAADEREHLAGARIDRDQGRLSLPPLAPPRQDLVDAQDPFAHHVLRDALQVDVERGVDVESRGRAGHTRQLLRHRLSHEVDEVRRLRLERALHDDERLAAGARRGIGRDEARLGHRPQHDVAPLPAPIPRVERRPHAGRLDDARNRRGFAQRQVRHVLAEEEPRRFGHPMDGEGAPLAEIHLVQVQLENLVLGGLALQDERHELLEQLAAERLLGRQEEILDQLLRQRAAADEVFLLAADVGDDGAHRADGIHAPVVVEAAILDGDDRLHHAPRNGGEGHLPPLLPSRAHEGGQERRIQDDAVGGRSFCLDAGDPLRGGTRAARLLHARALEDDAHHLAGAIAPPGDQRDGAPADGELAGPLDARPVRVPEIVQAVDELAIGERLPAVQLEGTREHARQHAIALAREARLDLPREGGVVVRERRDEHPRDRRQQDPRIDQPLAPAHRDPPEALQRLARGHCGHGRRREAIRW